MGNRNPPHDGDYEPKPVQFGMTLDQFIRRARDRGILLRVERTPQGRPKLTDGERTYVLPMLAPSLLTQSQIGSILQRFCDEDNVDLLLAEFDFDPAIDS